jgi:Flp pilus assembly protein TadD
LRSAGSALVRFVAVLALITFPGPVPLRLFAQTATANPAATKAYDSALSAIRAGDFAAAQSQLEQAVKLSPANAEMQLTLGKVLLHTGDLNGALIHLQTAIKLKPNDAQAHFYLGQALSSAGDFEDAIAELKEASKLAPKDAEPHRALARAWNAQNKNAEAIAEAQKAVALAPNSVGAHDELGSLLAQGGQLSEAEQQFRSALQLDAQYEPEIGRASCRERVSLTV